MILKYFIVWFIFVIQRTHSETVPRVIRTPEKRFKNLSEMGYPWKPNYLIIEIAGKPPLRMHYIDEGNEASRDVVLLLHGTPAWSYLYRKMIPPLLQYGYRVIAPDFIGFGRSDKLTDPAEYNHNLHVQSLLQLLHYLDLTNINLFAHDLGGPTGLTAVRLEPFRFKRLMLFNTWIPQGDIFSSITNTAKHAAYLSFRLTTRILGNSVPVRTIFNTVVSNLPKNELAGYEAPFPSNIYKVAPSTWPLFIPINEHESFALEMKLVKYFLKSSWRGPAIFGYSDGELFTVPGRATLREVLPYACEKDVSNAGHFLQDDQGEEMAYIVIHFILHGCNGL